MFGAPNCGRRLIDVLTYSVLHQQQTLVLIFLVSAFRSLVSFVVELLIVNSRLLCCSLDLYLTLDVEGNNRVCSPNPCANSTTIFLFSEEKIIVISIALTLFFDVIRDDPNNPRTLFISTRSFVVKIRRGPEEQSLLSALAMRSGPSSCSSVCILRLLKHLLITSSSSSALQAVKRAIANTTRARVKYF